MTSLGSGRSLNPFLLVLSGVRGDTRRYRTIHLYEQSRLAGLDCQLSHITDTGLPDKISQASIVILHRISHDPYVERLLQTIHNRQGLLLADVDDLVFDTSAFQWIASPDFKDPLRAALYQEDMRRQLTTLKACHAALASTQYLANQVAALGKPAWVHRNGFSLEMLALSEDAFQKRSSKGETLTIGYASGTPTHDEDFQIVKPALKQVLRRYKKVQVWIVGPLNPGNDWSDLGSRFHHHKRVPWRKLPALLAQFDINLAPLVMDNPFGQSKSEIKYMEAGLVRVPTIASPTDAFRFAIQHGENGCLAATHQEWVDSLCALIEGAELRYGIGEAAYARVIEQYHPFSRSKALISTLERIQAQILDKPFGFTTSTKQNRRAFQTEGHQYQQFWVDPTVENRPTLPEMAMYTLRNRGWRVLLNQIRIYLRRLAAPVFPYSNRK